MPNLKGKVAIITGASSGIGAATAEYFASLGAGLSLSGRNLENLESTRAKCIATGGITDAQASQDALLEGKVLAGTVEKFQIQMERPNGAGVITTQCEVTKREELEKLVDATIKKFGDIHILVNAAGIMVNGGVTTAPIDAYDEVMDVNVRSMVHLCQLAAPHLVKTKGSIVNVSSIAGPCSFPAVTYYCMSKSAVDQLTKCLALELAPQGVRVNAVNPGVIITNIHKRGGMNDEDYAKFLERAKVTHALGRPAESIEVAKAIAFLASDDASFTTGELLRTDGGRGIITPR